jgi:hypothetical protein
MISAEEDDGGSGANGVEVAIDGGSGFRIAKVVGGREGGIDDPVPAAG